MVSGTRCAALPSQGLVWSHAREDHEGVEHVTHRPRKAQEGEGLRKLCGVAAWQGLTNLRARRDERGDQGNPGKVASRAVDVGDDVVVCGGETGVVSLAGRHPFGGDVVLGGRPRSVRENELGGVVLRSLRMRKCAWAGSSWAKARAAWESVSSTYLQWARLEERSSKVCKNIHSLRVKP